MAVQHMARHRSTCSGRVSVASMAQSEQIPQPLLAKVMQGLKRAGLTVSVKGVGGGYQLARPLAEILFLEVVAPFEDQLALVDCADGSSGECERLDCCSLQDPMKTLNRFLMTQLSKLTMADFLTMSQPSGARSPQLVSTRLGVATRR